LHCSLLTLLCVDQQNWTTPSQLALTFRNHCSGGLPPITLHPFPFPSLSPPIFISSARGLAQSSKRFLTLKLCTFLACIMTRFYVLLYRLHVLLALTLNQTPRCNTGLILVLQKNLQNQTPVGASSPQVLPWRRSPPWSGPL